MLRVKWKDSDEYIIYDTESELTISFDSPTHAAEHHVAMTQEVNTLTKRNDVLSLLVSQLQTRIKELGG